MIGTPVANRSLYTNGHAQVATLAKTFVLILLSLSILVAERLQANNARVQPTSWSIICPLDDCTRPLTLSFEAEYELPLGTLIDGLPVGGLSGIDSFGRGGLVAISDDRSEKGPARLIKLKVDFGRANQLVFKPTSTIVLHRQDGSQFPPQSIDPESVRFLGPDALFVSSEGNPDLDVDPSVFQFTSDGRFIRALELPSEFAFEKEYSNGSRKNLSLEGLALISPHRLVAVSESALVQDSAPANAFQGSRNRVVEFDLKTGTPVGQYIYVTDPVARTSDSGGSLGERGVSEIVGLRGRQLLILEREVYPGQHFEAALYIASLPPPSDQMGLIRKTKIFDFREAGFNPDNLEGLAIVSDKFGRQHLIICSDNNFSANQRNQFLSFRIQIPILDRPASALP